MYRRRQHIVNFFHGWSAGSLLFFAGIALYASAGRDDVFKSLWPAWTLSEMGEIVNYNGEALEQSSSMLQVLLVGGMHRLLGGDIVLLGGLMAILAGMATVMFSQWLAQELEMSTVRMRWTAWLVAGSSFVTYWSWGGLEASLAAFCMLLFAANGIRIVRQGKWPGFVLATIAFLLVRPENMLVASLALVGLLALAWWKKGREWPWKRVQLALGIVLACSLLLILFRLWMFGAWMPHPVLAKAGSWGPEKVYRGAAYLFWEMWKHPEFLVLCLLFATGMLGAVLRREINKLLLPLLLVLSGGLFVVVSGGDWMENGRFFVPLIPVMIILLLAAWEKVQPQWIRIIPILFFTVECLGLIHTARFHSTGQPLGIETGKSPGGNGYSFIETANRIHMRDLLISRYLPDLVGDIYRKKQAPVTLLSQQAGMVIFHTAKKHYGRLHFIDLVALSTHHFLECPVTRDRGATYGGLNMDLFYLFSDRDRLGQQCDFELPDIIFDLDNERHEKEKLLQANGYTIVFRQTGELIAWLPKLPGLPVGAWQIVALRNDWQDHLNRPVEQHRFP